MTALVDTSVLIDTLHGDAAATSLLLSCRRAGPVHASEITRAEVLRGMRPRERRATESLLSTLTWHPLDTGLAELAGDLGRRWLPTHRDIDTADLVIAATAVHLEVPLLTRNVKHFPMFPDLAAPY
ncbi:PIN domain protein [Serinicoccus hydrothermalis]|uniref:Ribonuclease VapC n=1 Tax=Serinicoccus hydrothermalis TaxID=1758689 RepID=A0A1B1NAW7_9MICO|nr:type II toxin-antitoxin system VapC family toxin [Serinicoccus hydrothermalis]ANS78579.1 PIN domain protein [Serinicoccus hydrothermalis]